MEFESKLLDKDYLTIRLNEFDDVKKRKLIAKIVPSNRPYSKSLYVWLKSGVTTRKMRISDHYNDKYPYTQFIVTPDAELKKSKKTMLFKTIEKNIKLVQHNNKMREFYILEKYGNVFDKEK